MRGLFCGIQRAQQTAARSPFCPMRLHCAGMSSSVRIPDGFVDELKARIRPSDVIGRKVKLTKKGKKRDSPRRRAATTIVISIPHEATG